MFVGRGWKWNAYTIITQAYILELLPHLCILMNQLGDLFLQAFVLLHKKLVHGSHFPVDRLKP
jgi:hypothetical protein